MEGLGGARVHGIGVLRNRPLQPPHPWRANIRAADLALFVTVVIVWGASWLPLRLQLGVVAPEVSGV